jgi:hypothetical protein
MLLLVLLLRATGRRTVKGKAGKCFRSYDDDDGTTKRRTSSMERGDMTVSTDSHAMCLSDGERGGRPTGGGDRGGLDSRSDAGFGVGELGARVRLSAIM